MKNKIVWGEVELESVCHLVTDGTHSKTPLVERGVGMPLVTSKDLTERGISFDKVLYITKKQHLEIIRRSKAEMGDILFSKIGTIGKPTLVNVPFEFSIKNVALFKLKKEIISNKFLVYYLKHPAINTLLNIQAGGGNQKFISLKNLRKIRVALPLSNGQPDLKEQDRIVQILEKAEKLKERSKKAEELLDEYLKSVFNEMFYNKGFEEVELKFLNTILSRGKSPKYADNSNIKIINQKCIYWNKIKFENVKFHQDDKNIGEKYFLRGGDILINSTGTGTLGRAVVFNKKDDANYIYDSHVTLIRPNEKIKSSYFCFYLNTLEGQSRLYSECVSGSTNQIELSKSKLEKFKILLPPTRSQQKFASIVEQVEKMKENIRKSQRNSEEMFNSLMQKAFRGELRE